MAKVETDNPMIFDATTQSWTGAKERSEGYGQVTLPNGDKAGALTTQQKDADLTPLEFKSTNRKLYIRRIIVETGSGGAVLVEESSAGKDIINFASTSANDTINFEVGYSVPGLYITTLPASARVLVYHGRNA